ncbi:MAG TPA: ABC transporter permease subunit [Planctomycetota bacterium]|nr:ABC transporter permease subunit [Planctomycetota bacterium]
MNRRSAEESIFKGLMGLSFLAILAALATIVGTVVWKGLPAMNWDMLTKTPSGGFYLGGSGGVLNAIVGSLYLAGGATVASSCLALPIVLGLNVYARRASRLVTFTRFSMDVLAGVPSIVFGAVGYVLMVALGLKASLLAGIIAVALLILPIMIKAMDEVVRLVPQEMAEASAALGATRLETAFLVVARQALPGLATAVLIAFGRGVGDAASVLFTAGFTDNIPDSLMSPAATLPLAVFFQLGSNLPEVQERAYAAALILMAMILIVSLVTRELSRRLSRHNVR